jgi:cell division protein FtsI/penicillin-binding protein 2
MAKIGQKLGAEKLYEGLRFFCFGGKVGVELPGEAEGLLRPVSQWTGYSVTRIPFGQEISVTTMQMVRAFCILANHGRVVQPHLVKAFVDPNGTLIDAHPAKLELGYVVRPEVADWIVTEALTGVINEGTGQKAKLDQWQVFGKTGTAQLADADQKGYVEGAYIASFCGGAPVQDPKVVVLVSVRRPNRKLGKGYTGGAVAAPVAGEILENTLKYLDVPPETDPHQRKLVRAIR